VRAREPDDCHRVTARCDDQTRAAVYHRWPGELREGAPAREHLACDGVGSRYGLSCTRTLAAGVDPEDDIGVEHRHERIEVALARCREKGIHELALLRQVNIAGRCRTANASSRTAGELTRVRRRRPDDWCDLVERHGEHVVQDERQPFCWGERIQDDQQTGAAKALIAELAETLGLADILERTVASYSGGQRRRLEIARALVSGPRVLFLDEPTVGLDPRIRFELLDAIAGLREREEMTIVLTTHYLEEAQRLCDRVAIIHAGEIVALDTPGALLAGLGSELLELRVQGDVSVALAALGAHGIAAGDAFVVGSTLTVPLHDATAGEAIAAINQAGLTTSAISSRQPTLDDVYLRLTGADLAAAA
jgi:ABC-2 type transport system ATP-binding protein